MIDDTEDPKVICVHTIHMDSRMIGIGAFNTVKMPTDVEH